MLTTYQLVQDFATIHRMMATPLGLGRRAEPWALSFESHGQVMW